MLCGVLSMKDESVSEAVYGAMRDVLSCKGHGAVVFAVHEAVYGAVDDVVDSAVDEVVWGTVTEVFD